MTRVKAGVLAAAMVAVGYWWGRHGGTEPAKEEAGSPVLATWDGGALRASEVDAYVELLGPNAAQRVAEPEARAQLVANLARRAVLVSVARAQGLTEAPQVRRTCDDALLEAYRLSHLEQRIAPSEAEVRAAYDARPELYSQPERIRLARILLPSTATPQKAEALLREVRRKQERDAYAFADLAQSQSVDGTTRAAGGELPAMTSGELEQRYGAEVAQRVRALQPGAILGEVLQGEQGLELLQLIAQLPATSTPFERVKDNLAQNLSTQAATRRWEEHVAELERTLGLTVMPR